MKKIIMGVSMIVAVAAIVVTATTAYFSDTETSAGNTFMAGSIDLTVTSEGTSTNGSCSIGPNDGNAIFKCNDVKPGDSGESTIHFNLTSNPAWACIRGTNVIDSDNTCVEPELALETGCTPTGDGELDENLMITAWIDNNEGVGYEPCDNKWEEGEEIVVKDALLSQFMTGQTSFTLPVSDTSNETLMNEPLQPGEHCVGIKWSVPTETTNIVQTDSFGADLEFYVEQSRNNPNFRCTTSEEPGDNGIPFISAVGAVNDQEASSKEWYSRYVGNPAPTGYAHSYQWAAPAISCNPNTTTVNFSGTINVSAMASGNVAFIGLLDKGLLVAGKSGYQSGAYIYVYKMANGKFRIGPTDGNLGGEIVDTFKDYDAPGDGTFDISLTIGAGSISVTVDGDVALVDTYGVVKVLNNLVANGYYTDHAEFENGAVPGWDNYLSNTMPYNLTLTGCN